MEQATELSEKLKHLIYSGVIKALKDIDVEEFVKVCDLPFPGLIIFQRPASMLIDDLSSHRLTINREMDEQVLVVTPIARFISLVHSFVTGSLEATPDIEPKMNLAQFADELLATFLPKRIKLTFVVFNIDSYYKELKLLESAMVKNAITGKSENVTAKKYPILNSCRVTVNREQVMQATVRLQVTHRVTFIWPSSPAQLSEIILAFAKAISERQSRQKTHSFSFLPEGELAQGVRVDASGKGLREVWKRALLQCFGVSFQDGAEAIAYRACHNELEKQLLLANIKIRTKNNFSRRLGDVFSRKVYLAMTSKDPCLKIV
ncbi:unnamed protein product [Soboliphyme baturini]|uniref:ERCC4 domain-containing protein n=1 Tax=Soboliphyme baturini TaxID=241478 RepID=A0A183J3C4_9BILA|nr:unnamed protein product [Soboliphyme baturini]